MEPSSGCNVIPRRAHPGLAGLKPDGFGAGRGAYYALTLTPCDISILSNLNLSPIEMSPTRVMQVSTLDDDEYFGNEAGLAKANFTP